MRPTAMLVPGAVLLVLSGASAGSAETLGLRIRFGLTDAAPTDWNGSVGVAPGRVTRIQGWRFRDADRVIGTRGWRASTRSPRTVRRSNRPERARAVDEPPLDNGVTLTLDDVTEASVVHVETGHGRFELALRDLPFGRVRTELGGAVEIERTAAVGPLTSGPREDDFPAAAVDARGRTHVAWVRFSAAAPGAPRILELRSAPADFAFLAAPTGGDQVWLTTLTAGAGTGTFVSREICLVAASPPGQRRSATKQISRLTNVPVPIRVEWTPWVPMR